MLLWNGGSPNVVCRIYIYPPQANSDWTVNRCSLADDRYPVAAGQRVSPMTVAFWVSVRIT